MFLEYNDYMWKILSHAYYYTWDSFFFHFVDKMILTKKKTRFIIILIPIKMIGIKLVGNVSNCIYLLLAFSGLD